MASKLVSTSWFSTQRIRDDLRLIHYSHIATYKPLQQLPIDMVYPGHYRIFGHEGYHQILQDYLEQRCNSGCPSESLVPVEAR